MSTNDRITDALTRHQIFVLRYAKGQEKDAMVNMERMLNDVISRLPGDITSFSRSRFDALILDLLQYMQTFNGQYNQGIVQQMLDFAQDEVDFNVELIGKQVAVQTTLPAPAQIASGIYSSVLDLEPTKGYTIGRILEEFGNKKAKQIVDFIRDGFTLGQTTQEITKRIKDNSDLLQSQAATVARTVTTHTSIQARNITMKENNDVLRGYEWVSTLDSRTSIICASRDGIVYEVNDSNPKPPAHFNCRSTITFVVKDEFNLGANINGTRASKGADGPKQVSENTNYEQWLRRQPISFIYEVLGITRGNLFVQGKLSIGAFVDNSGRVLSLEQLRALRPMAFGDI